MLIRLCPHSKTKDLGKAYNEAMKLLPPKSWACITDNDVLLLQPDAIDIMAEYIRRYPQAGLFTCYTNRIGNAKQLLNGAVNEDDRIAGHIELAVEQRKNLYNVTSIGAPISGFLMLLNKEVWNKYRFDELGRALNVDDYYSLKLHRAGLKIYRMDGLYVWHTYRLTKGINYKEHLK